MKRTVVLAALLLPSLAIQAPASADGSSNCPRPQSSGGGSAFSADLNCTNGADGSVRGVASDGTTYTWSPVCEKDYGDVNPQTFAGCTGNLECGDSGLIYEVTVTPPGGEPSTVTQCLETPKRRPSQREAYDLLKEVPLPKSTIYVQPPNGKTLVNLPTIMSTQAEGFTSDPIKLRDYTVVFTITPDSYLWHHGDGTDQPTGWPGRRWTKGDDPTSLVNHVYQETASGLEVSVDTTWSATWTLDGEPQGPVDGTVTIEGDSVELSVLEAKPQLVAR